MHTYSVRSDGNEESKRQLRRRTARAPKIYEAAGVSVPWIRVVARLVAMSRRSVKSLGYPVRPGCPIETHQTNQGLRHVSSVAQEPIWLQ